MIISNTSRDACMDTFYDAKTSEQFSVYIECIVTDHNSKMSHDREELLYNFLSRRVNFNNTEISTLESNAIKNQKIVDEKRYLSIPKCCSEGHTFDIYTKSCVDSGFDDFNLIFGQDVTFDYYTGTVFCSSVQVDYTIPTKNVYFEGKNALVSFYFEKYSHINKNKEFLIE